MKKQILLSLPFIGTFLFGWDIKFNSKKMVLGTLWGSIAASVTASFNFTYVPQFISFTIGTVPTSIKIESQGDGVIFTLDGTGATNMNGIRQVGVVANTYIYQIANGLINGKNGSVTIANAAAAQLDVFCWSKDIGNMYMTYLTQQALANSGLELRKFAYAAFPSAAAGDQFTISYNNKVTQNSFRLEQQNALAYSQQTITARYNIDNIAPATVDTVTFIPAATQNVYVMQYQAAKGTVNAAVTARY